MIFRHDWVNVVAVATMLTASAAAGQRVFDGGPTGTGNTWLTPENWTADNLPDTDDRVIIDRGFAVTLSAGPAQVIGNFTLGSGLGDGTLTIDGGNLTADGSSNDGTSVGLARLGNSGGQGTLELVDGSLNVQFAMNVGDQNGKGLIHFYDGFDLDVAGSELRFGDPPSHAGNLIVFGLESATQMFNVHGQLSLVEIAPTFFDIASFGPGFSATPGTTYTIISYDAWDGDPFGNVPDETDVMLNGVEFYADYTGDSSTAGTFSLTVVPEPASLGLLGLGGLIVLTRRSR